MRAVINLTFLLLLTHAFLLCAQDADELREKGIAALKESQANPRAIVEAARAFVKAEALYVQAGNDEKSVEMNSFLYWCKKKMAMEDIDAFVKGGEEAVSTKLNAIEKLAPKADEAQAFLDRAEQFAYKNPAEHLLIAIRFYEVADRFKGSDTSMKAMDRSLKEQLQDKSGGAKSTLPPTAIRVPDNAPATVGSRAVPSAEEIKQAEKLIKDLLKDEYVKTDAAGRLALATKLLQQADENKGDPASEYVLLHEARDYAVMGGDSAQATNAQKRLRDIFKINFAAMLIDLRKLEATSRSADSAAALATLLSLGADDALAVDNYDQAVRYNSRAEDLLPLIKNAALKDHLKTEVARVLALKQASIAALAAQKILSTKPEDPEANLAVGRFALQKGEFEKAFAMLAKSSDKALAGIAKRELTPAAEAPEQAKLGDDWFDLTAKESNTYVKKAMQERAGVWYGNALPALTGLAKLKVEGRMKTLPANVHSEILSASQSLTVVKSDVVAAPKGGNSVLKPRALPKITVIKAIFGIPGSERDVTKFWQTKLDGSPYSYLYGGPLKPDPAPGRRKLLTAQLLVDGIPQTFTVLDVEVFVWPWLYEGVPTQSPEFKILSAEWGASAFVNVTKKVQELAPSATSSFDAKDMTDTDPSPSLVKWLVIFFTRDNKLFMRVFKEGDPVRFDQQ